MPCPSIQFGDEKQFGPLLAKNTPISAVLEADDGGGGKPRSSAYSTRLFDSFAAFALAGLLVISAVLHVRRVNNGTPSTHPQGDELRALRRSHCESACQRRVSAAFGLQPFA
jgi:hypothetical protein